MFTVTHRTWKGARISLLVAVPALLVSACGGSSGSGSAQNETTSAAATSTRTAMVETRSGNLGTFLTDGSGRTLYLFAADHGTRSACTGACASAWPPFTTRGTVRATGQAKTSELGTTNRNGDLQQVTYAGHPLYYFAGDQGAGDTNGQGSNGFGAKWWVVAPTGTAITHSTGGATSPYPSGGSSGGGGWG